MIYPVYLRAAARFDGTGVADGVLKRHFKTRYDQDARRLSRLTLLALAGSLPLAVAEPAEDTPVYLGGLFSSASVLDGMMDNVFHRQLAKPFDLLANLHNAPAFQTAAALGLNGPTIFEFIGSSVESWSKPLLLAVNQVQQNGGEALVGWVHETRTSDVSREEGSYWLLLGREKGNGTEPPQFALCRTAKPAAAETEADEFFLNAVKRLILLLEQGGQTVVLPAGGSMQIDISAGNAVSVFEDKTG